MTVNICGTSTQSNALERNLDCPYVTPSVPRLWKDPMDICRNLRICKPGSDRSVSKTPWTRSVSSHIKQLHDVPLGSLLIWLRCSSPQSLSRHTPPPGTSYGHTRRSGLRLVNRASERCSTTCFNSLRPGRGIGEEG